MENEITAEHVGPIWDGNTKYEKVLLHKWDSGEWMKTKGLLHSLPD